MNARPFRPDEYIEGMAKRGPMTRFVDTPDGRMTASVRLVRHIHQAGDIEWHLDYAISADSGECYRLYIIEEYIDSDYETALSDAVFLAKAWGVEMCVCRCSDDLMYSPDA